MEKQVIYKKEEDFNEFFLRLVRGSLVHIMSKSWLQSLDAHGIFFSQFPVPIMEEFPFFI